MEDIREAFTAFKSEFPGLYEKIDAGGRAVQVEGGPLDEQTRAQLLVIPTCGFPAFMEGYSTYKDM
jgi:hypothetical protein